MNKTTEEYRENDTEENDGVVSRLETSSDSEFEDGADDEEVLERTVF